MSVVINTNVDSIKIQSLLSGATGKMSDAMQRMSSGLKILNAKDDAAGTVISAKMQVQLNGNQIAQKNVQNANALLSTAEGNLDVIQENVSRIRDLTLQAKNGTYSEEEIKAMQDEVDERIAEINRINDSASFSSLRLFGDVDESDNPAGLAAKGATFQVGSNDGVDNTIMAEKELFQAVTFSSLTGTRNFSLTRLANAVTKKTDNTGFDTDEVEVIKTDADDANITKQALGDTMYISVYDETNNKSETVKDMNVTLTGGNTGTVVDKETETMFDVAIRALDKAIDDITDRKSIIGSAGNRMDSAMDTLTTQYENLTSAKSIITDADIASEASNFTQQSILQQVSTSLLAQANQAPGIALSLV